MGYDHGILVCQTQMPVSKKKHVVTRSRVWTATVLRAHSHAGKGTDDYTAQGLEGGEPGSFSAGNAVSAPRWRAFSPVNQEGESVAFRRWALDDLETPTWLLSGCLSVPEGCACP